MNAYSILNNNYCAILTLHRVHPLDIQKLSPNESLKISPEKLDSFIYTSKKKGVKFISLDELFFRLKNSECLKKTAVITLDDGYKDNFIWGKSIFESTNTPYSVFITTDLPDKKAALWWFFLEDQLLSHDKVCINKDYEPIIEKSRKEKLFMDIRHKILESKTSTPIEAIEKIFNKKYDANSYNEKYSASWGDIVTSSKNSLCTIGAHTISHRNLALLDQKIALKEISESKTIIERKIKKTVDFIAYPFGGEEECGDREFSLAKNSGFSLGLTTRWGSTFNSHSNALLSLPRIPLTEKLNWDMLRLQILKRTYYKAGLGK